MSAVRLPKHINNTTIQAIGEDYLARHNPNNLHFMFRYLDSQKHTNHPLAKKLKEYNEESTAYEKWHFLAECFSELPKSKGELAGQISRLFDDAFSPRSHVFRLIHDTNTINLSILDSDGYTPRDWTKIYKLAIDQFYIDEFRDAAATLAIQSFEHLPLKSNPDALSNSMIKTIGDTYYKKFPTITVKHNNHKAADTLRSYQDLSSPYEKWMFLADVYSQLQESKGQLSDLILGLLVNAFHKSVYTHELSPTTDRYGGHNDVHFYPPKLVSDGIKAIINEHYAHQFRQQIQTQLISQPTSQNLAMGPA